MVFEGEKESPPGKPAGTVGFVFSPGKPAGTVGGGAPAENGWRFGWLALLRNTEPVDDGLDLAGGEGFALGIVADGLQFVPEHVVAADECHEVLDGGFGGAVGEEEEGKFFLCVCSNGESVHDKV